MRWLRIGFVAALLISVGPLVAQGQDVQWGVRGGLMVSDLRGDVQSLVETSAFRAENGTLTQVTTDGPRNGFHVTGFASLPLRDWLAVQAELQYAQKGLTFAVREYDASKECRDPLASCRPSAPVRESTLSYRMSYLQVPALLKVRLPFGDAFRTHLVGGGSVGVPLHSEWTASSSPPVDETAIREPDAHMEGGAVLGIEMSYQLGAAGTILLDGRLNPGFTDIPLEQSASSVRTTTGAISLGYAFR